MTRYTFEQIDFIETDERGNIVVYLKTTPTPAIFPCSKVISFDKKGIVIR